MSTAAAFRRYIERNVQSVFTDKGGGSRRTETIIRITDAKTRSPRLVLWAKGARERHGPSGYFWGINEHQLNALNTAGTPWWLVLLSGSREDSYVVSSAQVNNAVQAREWRPQYDPNRPEFKIHESPQIRGKFPTFHTFADVIAFVGL